MTTKKDKTTDKVQRVAKYISGYGVTCYEIEQYNKTTGGWYIVGQVYQSRRLAQIVADQHNVKLF